MSSEGVIVTCAHCKGEGTAKYSCCLVKAGFGPG